MLQTCLLILSNSSASYSKSRVSEDVLSLISHSSSDLMIASKGSTPKTSSIEQHLIAHFLKIQLSSMKCTEMQRKLCIPVSSCLSSTSAIRLTSPSSPQVVFSKWNPQLWIKHIHKPLRRYNFDNQKNQIMKCKSPSQDVELSSTSNR